MRYLSQKNCELIKFLYDCFLLDMLKNHPLDSMVLTRLVRFVTLHLVVNFQVVGITFQSSGSLFSLFGDAVFVSCSLRCSVPLVLLKLGLYTNHIRG